MNSFFPLHFRHFAIFFTLCWQFYPYFDSRSKPGLNIFIMDFRTWCTLLHSTPERRELVDEKPRTPPRPHFYGEGKSCLCCLYRQIDFSSSLSMGNESYPPKIRLYATENHDKEESPPPPRYLGSDGGNPPPPTLSIFIAWGTYSEPYYLRMYAITIVDFRLINTRNYLQNSIEFICFPLHHSN